jgi:type III pantothenate kinase
MANLLAFDIGNTNLKIGLWDGASWRAIWRVHTAQDQMPDEWGVLLRGLLAELGLGFSDIEQVVLASVVPALTRTFQTVSGRFFQQEALILKHDLLKTPRVALDIPQQVGADRLANAIAADTLYNGAPILVLDCGTATKLEYISSGVYHGGAIAPGLRGMLDSLAGGTAQLFRVDLVPPPSPIGKNTVHALQSGVVLGYLGLIESLIERFKAEMPPQERAVVRVIGTGGLGAYVQGHSSVVDELAPNLTLDGLRILAEQNASS